jgi:hypothetical protein
MAKIKITNFDKQSKNLSKEPGVFAIEVEELSDEQASLVVGGKGTGGTGSWPDKKYSANGGTGSWDDNELLTLNFV